MGRSEKKKVLQIQMDPALKELLEDVAKKENRSMSSHAEYLIREALHRYLHEHGFEGEEPNAQAE